jgi:hypothetical protein
VLGLTRHCGDGKAVADDNLKIDPPGTTGRDLRLGRITQRSTQLGLGQVIRLRRGARGDFKQSKPLDQVVSKVADQVEFGEDGIAREGVVGAEVELGLGPIGGTCSTEKEPRGRSLAGWSLLRRTWDTGMV